jgi:hypothetical protein
MLCLFTSFGNIYPNYTIPDFYEILPLHTEIAVCAKPCNKIGFFLQWEGNKATIKKCALNTIHTGFQKKRNATLITGNSILIQTISRTLYRLFSCLSC